MLKVGHFEERITGLKPKTSEAIQQHHVNEQ
jgi:hypothetical protein